MAASKHEQTPITSIDREPVGTPVGSAESVPTPADRIRSLITEHDAMGHDGLGCGCLDAIDVIIDSAGGVR